MQFSNIQCLSRMTLGLMLVLMATACDGCPGAEALKSLRDKLSRTEQERDDAKAQLKKKPAPQPAPKPGPAGPAAGDLARLQGQVDALKAQLKASEGEKQEVNRTKTQIAEQLAQALANLSAAQAAGAGAQALRNPTWPELKQFLLNDDTSKARYVEGKYMCGGFAITLRNKAHAKGFKAAWVQIGLGSGNAGHALNAFDTSDGRRVYVDATGNEDGTGTTGIFYVEVGKPYAKIPLQYVRETYHVCAGPKECSSLNEINYSGNIFEMSYYENYRQRHLQWDQARDEHERLNEQREKDRVEFGKLPNIQKTQAMVDGLNSRLDTLNSWVPNLNTVISEMKTLPQASGVVTRMEIYW